MKTSDFFFELPANLIAQYPPEQRGQSRLMTLDRITGKRTHRMVGDLPDILCGPEFLGLNGALPLLVFNDSRVRKARLFGKSVHTGSQVEFLLLEKVNTEATVWKSLVQRSKRRKTGSVYVFYDTEDTEIARAEITDKEESSFENNEYRYVKFDRPVDDVWLDRYGHIPLPPYIKRQDAPPDAERYQTVYANAIGSSAAPTAGLHFTQELMSRLKSAGIDTEFITLHVGLGTFLPIRSEHIENHIMHNESYYIDEQSAIKIESAKAAGRKIIAIGTTSVRTLESAFQKSGMRNEKLEIKRGDGSTSIFIFPGYPFKIIDALFTNFHTPESTLLMLVSAFAGRELILESYAEAIAGAYRFFSYGDAMLIS